MMAQDEFERIARDAVGCRRCFSECGVKASSVTFAQPRWVGPLYWSASRRVVLMLLNPGNGGRTSVGANAELQQLLSGFRNGSVPIQAIMEHQRDGFPRWGRGRMAKFYLEGLGLSMAEVAFANVAWCATEGNRYPDEMLDKCFHLHTRGLLNLLRPTIVLLSGSGTHRFEQEIEHGNHSLRVIPMLHYAHRKGRDAQAEELARVRQCLAASP